MGPELLRALIAADVAAAEALLLARAPEEWPGLGDVFQTRLAQVESAPGNEPWLLRAVILEREARVVGVTGFHGPPGGDWLREHAPDGVEFGYTIFAGDRGRGYATEAGEGLVRWAAEAHGVRSYVLSIGPTNDASIRVAQKLGFQPVGAWVHPQRGREIVYRLTVEGPRSPAA